MSRRELSADAAVARSTYSGEELQYTNADRLARGTISEVGIAARKLWVRVGRSRRSLSSRLKIL